MLDGRAALFSREIFGDKSGNCSAPRLDPWSWLGVRRAAPRWDGWGASASRAGAGGVGIAHGDPGILRTPSAHLPDWCPCLEAWTGTCDAVGESADPHPAVPTGCPTCGEERRKQSGNNPENGKTSIFPPTQTRIVFLGLVDSLEAFLSIQNTRDAAQGPLSFTICSLRNCTTRRHNDELRNAFSCSDHNGIFRY